MSRGTLDTAFFLSVSPTGLSPPMAGFPKTVRLPIGRIMRSVPQDARILVWAPPRSLAATCGIEFFFLFLRVLRCFSSPGSPPCAMDSRMDTQGLPAWVSPFRNLRIKSYKHLPAAYRSLLRLSSALSAKASALCPFCLTFSPVILA